MEWNGPEWNGMEWNILIFASAEINKEPNPENTHRLCLTVTGRDKRYAPRNRLNIISLLAKCADTSREQCQFHSYSLNFGPLHYRDSIYINKWPSKH